MFALTDWCKFVVRKNLKDTLVLFARLLCPRDLEESTVEWSAARYSQCLKVLNDNAALFKKIPNPTLKGAFHNQRAMALRKLITAENRADAIIFM